MSSREDLKRFCALPIDGSAIGLEQSENVPYFCDVLSVVLFALLYLNFSIRMETVYFETDKLDREDELHRYREL